MGGVVIEPLTDLTGTSWYFNDTLSLPETTTSYSLNFTDGYTSRVGIDIASDHGTNHMYYLTPTPYDAYNNMYGWSDVKYRTIAITGGTDATNTSLIDWIQANATQI